MLPTPSASLSSLPALQSVDWIQWRQAAAIPERTPFLVSPTFGYDVDLNGFFLSGEMLGRAWNTQDGYARDLRAFLNFLWHNRNRTSWRDASAADHFAYLLWRRNDPAGPRIDDSTWDREVTAVNQFYAWQVRARNVLANPIPQRARRPASHVARRSGGEPAATTAAAYSHGAGREKIEWVPPATYRRWRDVGIRGYTPNGLPNVDFRGRWAARNALFSDVMVRTGLRLSEETALTVFEMPLDRGLGGVEAEAAIDRLAAAPADDRLVIREIWLLRLWALLARAHSDETNYRDYRDRYRAMAKSLCFEGHMAWAEAMP